MTYPTISNYFTPPPQKMFFRYPHNYIFHYPLIMTTPTDFLTQIFLYSSFPSYTATPLFTPRKIGLGYDFVPARSNSAVLRPARAAARKRRSVENAEGSPTVLSQDESSEEVSRMEYIKKRKEKKSDKSS